MKKTLAFLFAFLLLFAPVISTAAKTVSDQPDADAPEIQTGATSLDFPALVIPEAALSLPCQSAILIEQTTGTVLYAQNADEKLPIASVTKIMTLLLVMEQIDAGVLHLEDPVPISENAASMGGSQVFLAPGENISLNDVLKSVFVSSANDGAVALAELVCGSVDGFVAKMNEKAASLGMTGTYFENPTGLDDSETNLSTARDVALMSQALLSYEKTYDYTKIWMDTIRNGAFGLSNTNKLIRFYPGATGLKTGSTAKAKYCLSASAERGGLKLCAVALAATSSADRFQSAKTMLDYGFANFAFYQPDALDLADPPVWGGTLDSVPLSVDQRGFLLAKADAVGVKKTVMLPEYVAAPVEMGQALGVVQFKKDDQLLYEVPILAAESVPALGFGQILHRVFSYFFTGLSH